LAYARASDTDRLGQSKCRYAPAWKQSLKTCSTGTSCLMKRWKNSRSFIFRKRTRATKNASLTRRLRWESIATRSRNALIRIALRKENTTRTVLVAQIGNLTEG